jgi:hypothetical protein
MKSFSVAPSCSDRATSPPRRARPLSHFHQKATRVVLPPNCDAVDASRGVSDSPLLIYLSPAPLRGVAAAAEAVTKTSSAQRRRQRETVDGERRDSGLRQRGHEAGGWRTAAMAFHARRRHEGEPSLRASRRRAALPADGEPCDPTPYHAGWLVLRAHELVRKVERQGLRPVYRDTRYVVFRL